LSNGLEFLLDNIVWSYSSLSSYGENCKYGFYLNYIEKKENISGAFSEYGSFGHKLLEQYLKNELFSFELADEYSNKYSENVSDTFPPSRGEVKMYDSYYEKGLNYFSDTDSLEKLLDDYQILAVEDKCYFKIDKYNFVGILDVEAKTKNNEYIIIDHKSKSSLDKKRLPKKGNPDDYIKMVDGRYIPRSLINQQYLYCIPFYEKYKSYPKYLAFNMFRIQDWYTVEFNQSDFDKAKQWAINTINDIYNEIQWKPTSSENEFFCKYLCGCATSCKYCEKYIE
jgi:hypothetical protein